jgi:hypothetical protein
LALRGAITSPQRQHYKPLPLREIPEFKRSLRAYSGRAETIIAPRLLLILWILPGQLRRAHIVPLPYQAVEQSKTPAVSHQSEFLPERHKMLQQRADTIDAADAQVIPIGRLA